MSKYLAITVLAGALGLAGCATTEAPGTATTAKDSGEVVTESRVPRKGEGPQAVRNISKEEYERNSRVIGNAGKGN